MPITYPTGLYGNTPNSIPTPGDSAATNPITGIPSIGADLSSASSIAQLTSLLDSLTNTAQNTNEASAIQNQSGANAAALTSQVNANNAQQVPGLSGLQSQQSSDINSELSGSLPTDVLNLIAEQGAQRGVSTGMTGSDNANASMLQALGLTSLGQVQSGMGNLSSAVSTNRVANPVAPVGVAPVNVAQTINPLGLLPKPMYSMNGGGSSTVAPKTSNPALATSGSTGSTGTSTTATPAGTTATGSGGLSSDILAQIFGSNPATGNAGTLTADPGTATDSALWEGDETDVAATSEPSGGNETDDEDY